MRYIDGCQLVYESRGGGGEDHVRSSLDSSKGIIAGSETSCTEEQRDDMSESSKSVLIENISELNAE